MGSPGASGARKHEGHRPERVKTMQRRAPNAKRATFKEAGEGEGGMSLERRDENSVSGGAGGDGEHLGPVFLWF